MTTEIEKTESAADDLDLAALMDQIRKNADKRRRDSFKTGVSLFYRQLTTLGIENLLTTAPFTKLRLQPEVEAREQYQINELLGFQDEAFVRNAYKAILKREPDDAGMVEYLRRLRSGRYSKIDILRSLRFSPEGQAANVTIEGLGSLSAFRKLYRVPVFGYLLQLAVAIVRLPVLITNHRQLESHTSGQLELVVNHFNEAVANLSDESHRQADVISKPLAIIQELKNTLILQMDSLISEQEKIMQEQASWQNQSEQLQALKASFAKQFDEVIQRVQHVRMDIAQQEARLSRLLEGKLTPSPNFVPVEQTYSLTTEEDHLLDSLYYTLEDTLRGTPEQIKEEVKVYLLVLKNAGIESEILDVGCGRGEWLEVLKEAGLQARGIDTNRILVERCRSLSLDVSESEALTHLRSLADDGLNAVTAFHFAEHLPLKTLIRFLDEVGRVLKPGGFLILETPNPENLLVGSCNFYLDPTHQNPIPIPTMKLLLEARGFRIQDVIKLHSIPHDPIEVKDQLTSHVNHFLYGPMNYAVVARKPDVPHDPS